MNQPRGHLALVLHAHLPFVRHPEHEHFLEEDWLYEAITETYLPLVQMMDGLVADGIDFRLTMSMTPPLCSMLLDPLLQERYVQQLEKLLELCGKEIERTRSDPNFHHLAWFYQERLQHCRQTYEQYGRNLVGAFRKFQELGKLEIITCAATHGYLPLLAQQPEAVRAQILIARDHYRECFGRDPKGIWLPECAYFPGLDQYLQEAGIRWFILDTHGILFAEPQPVHGPYAPLFTPTGPAAFGRDMESSHQVWSAEEGYPGHVDYRDFYRDLGYDAPEEYIRPYVQADGMRKFTGLKYHRITGKTPYKEFYRPDVARERAARDAGDFLSNRVRQVEHLAGTMNVSPILVAPYDAELFGHWWFEGPQFLNFLLRKIACDQEMFKTITPSEYLRAHPTQQVATPCASSWGHKGYWEVWLQDSNDWIYLHLHEAGRRMTELVRRFVHANVSPLEERALRQLTRELLLAQASDWAFIMKTGTMVPYAIRRTKDHLLRFNRLHEALSTGAVDEAFLADCEWKDNLFPNVNWRYYA